MKVKIIDSNLEDYNKEFKLRRMNYDQVVVNYPGNSGIKVFNKDSVEFITESEIDEFLISYSDFLKIKLNRGISVTLYKAIYEIFVYPISDSSTAFATALPSAIAHTTKDCPLCISPAVNTFFLLLSYSPGFVATLVLLVRSTPKSDVTYSWLPRNPAAIKTISAFNSCSVPLTGLKFSSSTSLLHKARLLHFSKIL